ncbi:MAG: ABC transporter permease [Acetobacteraceae bacterium]|nr:ABC transporter permease [Acetobacteraceae bacterium]
MNALKILLNMPKIFWVNVALIVAFSLISNRYMTINNAINIMQQGAVLLVVTAAMTIVILSEGLDLSLGAVMTMAGIVSVLALRAGWPAPAAILAGVLSGAFLGAITGTLIALCKMSPFIASLGMQGVIYGFTLALTHSKAVFTDNAIFLLIGSRIGHYVPVAAILCGIIFLAVWAILHHTKFGRYVIAIGGNEAGARLSGVNTTFWKWFVYVFAGTVTAMGGVILAARLQVADPIVGVGWEFDAIAATVLGGTSLVKGRGDVSGSFLGVLLIVLLRNGMDVVEMPPIWEPALMGTIIILAIAFQVRASMREEARA